MIQSPDPKQVKGVVDNENVINSSADCNLTLVSVSQSGGMLNSNFSSISESGSEQPELGLIHGDNDSDMMSPSLDTETHVNHIKMKIHNVGPETNAHLKEMESKSMEEQQCEDFQSQIIVDLESSIKS